MSELSDMSFAPDHKDRVMFTKWGQVTQANGVSEKCQENLVQEGEEEPFYECTEEAGGPGDENILGEGDVGFGDHYSSGQIGEEKAIRPPVKIEDRLMSLKWDLVTQANGVSEKCQESLGLETEDDWIFAQVQERRGKERIFTQVQRRLCKLDRHRSELGDMSFGDEGYDIVSARIKRSSDELEKCFMELRGTSFQYLEDMFQEKVGYDRFQENVGYDGDGNILMMEEYPEMR